MFEAYGHRVIESYSTSPTNIPILGHMRIQHLCSAHSISRETKTLIVGTFNPSTRGNSADFFYGRSRNYLWELLPVAFGVKSLKGARKKEKLEFVRAYNIDFVDLIAEVDVDDPCNYEDAYLDDKITSWNNVIDRMKELPLLERVGFTRKSFHGIPNMRNEVDKISRYCLENNIKFKSLVTPARYYNKSKQEEWSEFLAPSLWVKNWLE